MPKKTINQTLLPFSVIVAVVISEIEVIFLLLLLPELRCSFVCLTKKTFAAFHVLRSFHLKNLTEESVVLVQLNLNICF